MPEFHDGNPGFRVGDIVRDTMGRNPDQDMEVIRAVAPENPSDPREPKIVCAWEDNDGGGHVKAYSGIHGLILVDREGACHSGEPSS